jgi:two-component system chemotaxis sensor kinase CheA
MALDPMAAIRDTFFQECDEQLAELEIGLLRIENGIAEPDTVNAVFRAVHSIKGGAGIFGLDALVSFSHVFESALDAVRAGRLSPVGHVMKLLLAASDLLADHVRAARHGAAVDEARTKAAVSEFEKLSYAEPQHAAADAQAAPATERAKTFRIYFRPQQKMYENGNDALLLLRELGRLGALEVDLKSDALPDLADMNPEGAYLAWECRLTSDCSEADIREIFEFVEDDCFLEIAAVEDELELEDFEGFEFFPPLGQEAEDVLEKIDAETQTKPEPVASVEPPENSTAKADAGHASNATIRVDLNRVDRLIDLVGELVINEAMLSQRVVEAGIVRGSGVTMALEELELLTREIQDSVMAIRAQPVRSVFQRMPRLVREVAALTGKQVRLLTEGEGTEVDRTVIERITDPLTHMIRNAIDHGLESPEQRLARGKPAEGVVRLNALHRSGRIVLEVTDDGGGINRDVVKAKAIEKGLLAADAQISDEDIDNLIFLPGFSTASSVSSISGRGVGMDVVRQSVQALGGRISIASRPGQGSTFTLSLPLTLAVLDGMVVTAAGQTLIVPLGAIVETLKPKQGSIHDLDSELKVMFLRGSYIPVIDVAQTLGYRDHPLDPQHSVALLLEGEGGARAVFLVDAIDGQRQVVIKSLEANYRAVKGIAAATVMGNGRVALILDIDAIVSSTRMDSHWPEKMRGDAITLQVH